MGPRQLAGSVACEVYRIQKGKVAVQVFAEAEGGTAPQTAVVHPAAATQTACACPTGKPLLPCARQCLLLQWHSRPLEKAWLVIGMDAHKWHHVLFSSQPHGCAHIAWAHCAAAGRTAHRRAVAQAMPVRRRTPRAPMRAVGAPPRRPGRQLMTTWGAPTSDHARCAAPTAARTAATAASQAPSDGVCALCWGTASCMHAQTQSEVGLNFAICSGRTLTTKGGSEKPEATRSSSVCVIKLCCTPTASATCATLRSLALSRFDHDVKTRSGMISVCRLPARVSGLSGCVIGLLKCHRHTARTLVVVT